MTTIPQATLLQQNHKLNPINNTINGQPLQFWDKQQINFLKKYISSKEELNYMFIEYIDIVEELVREIDNLPIFVSEFEELDKQSKENVYLVWWLISEHIEQLKKFNLHKDSLDIKWMVENNQLSLTQWQNNLEEILRHIKKIIDFYEYNSPDVKE